jgi:hypothetical protein
MSRRKHRTKKSPTPIDADSGASIPSDLASTDETVAAAVDQPEQSVLNIKVSANANVDSTLERLLHVGGFRAIEPLFPGETHPDLSTIYVAHVDSDRLATARSEVEADDDIEYVDAPPKRKLIK